MARRSSKSAALTPPSPDDLPLCPVAGRCGGCPTILVPLDAQRAQKRAHLVALFEAAGLDPAPAAMVKLLDCGRSGLRDRTDLTWIAPTLGLYDLAGAALVPVGACPALAPALAAFAVELAADPPPCARASLRLRLGNDGERGLWIDAANLTIKELLDEDAWLRRWAGRAFVELGQRRKPLLIDEGRLRLGKESLLRPWFATPLAEGRTSPLLGPVGGFSQPSRAANRVLVAATLAACDATGAARFVELGSGNGNFTLPLLARGAAVVAVELDRLALEGLEASAQQLGLTARLELCQLDVHHRASELEPLLTKDTALLVDPPRAGLRGFVDVLAAVPKPPSAIVYVSCYAESLVADLQRLTKLGYAVRSLVGVDQFPDTPHAEWVVGLQRATPPPL